MKNSKINICKQLAEFSNLELLLDKVGSANRQISSIIFQLFFLLMMLSLSSAQEIPNEFYEFKVQKLLVDAGQNWESNSSIGSVRIVSLSQRKISLQAQRSLPETNDSLMVQSRFGIYTKNTAVAFYGYGHFLYKKNFYGFVYPRIVNYPSEFQRYSGIPMDISRGGLTSGETDLSGIGFQNEWLLFQLGRGRQSWGAGENIQLALSENAPAYDYTMLGLDFGKLRVRYFHGFLESVANAINRYITARGLEWTNKKTLIIGLSETVIYSGENRSLDMGYFNPISTHLEIELNERLNTAGMGSANGVWQLSVDWLPIYNLRISGNLLYDEFTLDKIQFEEGKENGKAYSAKISFSPVISDKKIITLFGSTIFVGTPTFRHGDGNNNFVQRGKPLGWQYGSDGQEMKLGLNYFNMKNVIGNLEAGQREIGEESILNDPYEPYTDYLSGPFPSGLVNETVFISSQIQWWWKPNVSLMTEIEWKDSNIDGKTFDFNIGIDIYYPKSFKL